MENQLIKYKWSYLAAAVFFMAAVVRVPVGGDELRDWFEFVVRSATVFLMAACIIKWVNIWVGAFLLLALFSHSIPWLILSGGKYIQTWESYMALSTVMFGCILYSILSTIKLEKRILYNMLCIVALINVVFIIFQISGIDPYVIFGAKGNCSPTGLMSNRNETAAFIAICSPAFFRKKWAWFIPLLLLSLFCMRSFNGIIGIGAAVTVFIWLRGRRIAAVCAGTVATIFFVWYDGVSTTVDAITPRLYIWKNAILLTYDNCRVMGVGLGNWKIINQILTEAGWFSDGGKWSRIHNSFIQGYVEMGIVFIILVLGYLKSILSKNSVHMAALAAIVVCCSTNSLFRMNAINGMVVILWAAMLNERS